MSLTGLDPRAERRRRHSNVRSRLHHRYVWLPRAKLGILLKQVGCRMIHGPGHYTYGDQPRAAEGILACKSCGAYIKETPRG